MAKLKIKDLKHRERNRRRKLWEALAAVKINIDRLEEVRHNFQITATDLAIEELVSPQAKNALRSYGFDPLKPHYLNAKKTIVIKHIDVHIANSTKEDIISDIEGSDPRLRVEDVIHLPTSPKTIKIKFETIKIAKIAQAEGLTIMNQVIAPKNMEEEIYVRLIPCYICYGYDHKTVECPTPDLKICSECGTVGHTYLDCSNPDYKKCINCDNNHRTLAACCKVRKNIIKEKTKTILEEKHQSRQNRDKQKKQIPTEPNQTSQTTENEQTIPVNLSNQKPLPENAIAIITTAIIFATYHEIAEPGTYQQALDKTYQLNGLPTVKVPTPNNPEKFLQAVKGNLNIPADATQQNQDASKEKMDKPNETTGKRKKKRKKKPTKTPKMDHPVEETGSNSTNSDSELEALMAAAEANQEEMDEYYMDEYECELADSNYIQDSTTIQPNLSLILGSEEDPGPTNRDHVYRLTSEELTDQPSNQSSDRSSDLETESDNTQNTHINKQRDTTQDSTDEDNKPKESQIEKTLAAPSGELVVWAKRDFSEARSDLNARTFAPQRLGIKLIGTHRPPSWAENEVLYDYYDQKKLALVVEDQKDIPLALQCMDDETFDLTALRIRFYKPNKYNDMLEGRIPFTWDNS